MGPMTSSRGSLGIGATFGPLRGAPCSGAARNITTAGINHNIRLETITLALPGGFSSYFSVNRSLGWYGLFPCGVRSDPPPPDPPPDPPPVPPPEPPPIPPPPVPPPIPPVPPPIPPPVPAPPKLKGTPGFVPPPAVTVIGLVEMIAPRCSGNRTPDWVAMPPITATIGTSRSPRLGGTTKLI